VRTGERRLLWIEATAYAGRLLARGGVPWLEAADYIAWQRKAQSLLRSDVISLPLASLGRAYVHARPDLQSAMAAKRRVTYPLRVLLADEQFRAVAAALASDLRTAFPEQPMALVSPSPPAWITLAQALAHEGSSDPVVDDDDAEGASAYIADFLRVFAHCGLDVLLLREARRGSPCVLGDPSYVPIANLSAHYRWALGIRSPEGVTGDEPHGLSFAITPKPAALPFDLGLEVPFEFWSGEPVSQSSGSFLFAEIPENAVPEFVLERLGGLRAALRRESA
jgi:hypothetical protein